MDFSNSAQRQTTETKPQPGGTYGANAVIFWALRGSPAHKLTLLALSEFPDKRGNRDSVNPAVATLAEMTGLAERTIQYELSKAVARDEIEVVRHRDGGRGYSRHYRIRLLDRYDAAAKARKAWFDRPRETDEKGDPDAPFSESESAERVQSTTIKGDPRSPDPQGNHEQEEPQEEPRGGGADAPPPDSPPASGARSSPESERAKVVPMRKRKLKARLITEMPADELTLTEPLAAIANDAASQQGIDFASVDLLTEFANFVCRYRRPDLDKPLTETQIPFHWEAWCGKWHKFTPALKPEYRQTKKTVAEQRAEMYARMREPSSTSGGTAMAENKLVPIRRAAEVATVNAAPPAQPDGIDALEGVFPRQRVRMDKARATALVAALMANYPTKGLDPAAHDFYVFRLMELDPNIAAQVIDAWTRSDNAFPPTAGQLIASAEEGMLPIFRREAIEKGTDIFDAAVADARRKGAMLDFDDLREDIEAAISEHMSENREPALRAGRLSKSEVNREMIREMRWSEYQSSVADVVAPRIDADPTIVALFGDTLPQALTIATVAEMTVKGMPESWRLEMDRVSESRLSISNWPSARFNELEAEARERHA